MLQRGGKPALGIAAVTMLLTALSLAGCAGNEVNESQRLAVVVPSPVMAPPVSAPVQRRATKPTAWSKATSTFVSPFSRSNNLLSQRTINVEFDRYVIKEKFKPLIQVHAKYPSDHRSASIIVDGNLDDRSSREYNLGLGDRHGEAIREAMLLNELGDRQNEAASFGKEKPSGWE